MGLGSKGWIDLVPRLLHHFPAGRVERALIRGGQMVRRVLRASAAGAIAMVLAVSGLALGAGPAAAPPPDGPSVGLRVACTTTGELCRPAFAATFTATAATV